jgi:hypothetical protein
MYSALLAGLTLSRLAAARIADRRTVDWILLRALVVILIGFGVFWLARNFTTALAGLSIAGLGLGVQLRLPRFAGQVDYAAAAAFWWWILDSYSAGLR